MTAQELMEAREKRLQERGANDLRAILKTPEGRRFVWSMLTKGAIFQLSFTGDNNQTNFNEGKKSVALTLLNDLLTVEPKAYLQMTLEHTSEEKAFKDEVDKAKEMEDYNA